MDKVPLIQEDSIELEKKTLEEDYSLGLKEINILYINLGQLVSKRSYTIPYTLFRNRY